TGRSLRLCRESIVPPRRAVPASPPVPALRATDACARFLDGGGGPTSPPTIPPRARIARRFERGRSGLRPSGPPRPRGEVHCITENEQLSGQAGVAMHADRLDGRRCGDAVKDGARGVLDGGDGGPQLLDFTADEAAHA